MPSRLLHIYGPLYIQSYGVAITIGLLLFLFGALRHPWRTKIIGRDAFIESILTGILIGIAGGRLLFAIESWDMIKHNPLEIVYFWDGGFSILGTIGTLLIFFPFYLKKHSIPILAYLDLIALYAPLLQAIARVGCFFAGCCGGIATSCPSLIETHPTQLYSAGLHGITFLFFYYFVQKKISRAGQLIALYLICTSCQRFALDFLRADRVFLPYTLTEHLSLHQWIALGLMTVGCISLIVLTRKPVYYYNNVQKNH